MGGYREEGDMYGRARKRWNGERKASVSDGRDDEGGSASRLDSGDDVERLTDKETNYRLLLLALTVAVGHGRHPELLTQHSTTLRLAVASHSCEVVRAPGVRVARRREVRSWVLLLLLLVRELLLRGNWCCAVAAVVLLLVLLTVERERRKRREVLV